jgi:hypothetical protein
VPTLDLSESAPDPIRLLDLDCIVSALLRHGADLAHSLGADLSTFAFVFSFLGAWREEEVRVIAATQCNRLPRSITRYHRNSTILLVSVYARALGSDPHTRCRT